MSSPALSPPLPKSAATPTTTPRTSGPIREDAQLRPETIPEAGVAAGVWSSRQTVACVVVVAAVFAAAFASWQVAGAVVPWDSKNQFYAIYRFLGDALRQGIVPLWNPYVFSGYPAVADPQSLVFTPTMLLCAFLWPTASMPAFDAMIFAHLAAGAFGMLGLARRWRWHPAAGVLAALVFAFGGPASSRLQHTGMIISYAFFPLALWCLLAAIERHSFRLAVLAGLTATLMAIGRDQVAYLLCLALAVAAVIAAIHARKTDEARAPFPILVVAGLVTLLCMSVPILLTMQYLRDSNRPGIPYGMALEGSLDPVNLVTAFAPDAFGSLDKIYDYWGPGAASPAGNDWTDRTINYLFFGTLPFVLLLWHGLAGGRMLQRRALPFLALFAAALIYSLGRHTILFGAFFDWVPGVSLYRRPADATFVLTIAVAFLAGLLLDGWIRTGNPHIRHGLLTVGRGVAVAAGFALLVGGALYFSSHSGHLGPAAMTMVVPAFLALAVVLALLFARRRRPAVAALLVALTGAQLVWTNCASPLNAEPSEAYGAFSDMSEDETQALAILRQSLAVDHAAGLYPRVEILGLDGSWQNAAMVLKLEDTLGYNPLRVATYARAVGVGESANDAHLRSFPGTFRGYTSRLGALLGLQYLLLDRPLNELPRHIPRPRATLMYGHGLVFLYKLDTAAVPRATFAAIVVPVDDGASKDDRSLPAFDPATQALVAHRDMTTLPPSIATAMPASAPAQAPTGTATILDWSDNRVVISVEAPVAGVVVLHDPFYPGWTVRVDGRAEPVLHADLIFRGAAVPAGRHTVEFTFRPFSFANLAAAARRLIGGDDA